MEPTHFLKSENMEITFGTSPFEINGIYILPDRTKVCAAGSQQFLIRTPTALSDPYFCTKTQKFKSSDSAVEFSVADESEQYVINGKIMATVAGFEFSIEVEAPEPVWLVEWKLTGLQFEKVLVPALGGQEIDKSMPEGTTLSYKYPFWWNAQFVLGEIENGCLKLDSKDREESLKLLRVFKEKDLFGLAYGIEAKAPLNNKGLKGNWYLEFVKGSWENSVDEHRSWFEENYSVKPYATHQSFPAWMSEINFVLELWGARKSFKPSHTFKEMAHRLIEFKDFHDPRNTLLYLAGFAENGIDSHAPDYNPSIQCGGEDAFGELIETAHKLGYKVMIHTNVLAMTYTHRMYREFEKYQVCDVFNRPQGWAMDMDGDWLTEPYFAYMNPGYPEWSEYMIKVLDVLIQRYGIDAVFLDQTLLAFNVSKGPDFQKGMRDHVKRLQSAFPEILFAGEGIHELVVETLPVAQIHGIDSIAEVHGMEGHKTWRKVHEISAYFFQKYTKLTGHLLTKHPSHPLFKPQEEAYSQLNVIPTLCLYDTEQEIDIPEVKIMIQRANKLKG